MSSLQASPNQWTLNVKKSSGPIDTPWGAQLRNIEHRIREADKSGLRARWESGQHILKRRQGKQLPKGLLTHLCSALNVSQRELNYRVQFAEAYASQEKLSNAVAKFSSWHELVAKGLPQKRKHATLEITIQTKAIHGLAQRLHRINPGQISAKQMVALKELVQELHRIIGKEKQ